VGFEPTTHMWVIPIPPLPIIHLHIPTPITSTGPGALKWEVHSNPAHNSSLFERRGLRSHFECDSYASECVMRGGIVVGLQNEIDTL
jgi:hypothetical protein